MANATKYPKKLAAVSPDAIATALRACPLDRTTIRKLKDLSELVAKAPKDRHLLHGGHQKNDFLQIVLPNWKKCY